ncbi:MAG: pilin [Patescibacteria group bacterium]
MVPISKKKLLIMLVLMAVLMLLPAITSAFDIKLGIVGNIGSAECRELGNCDFCDWIDLFVVLQKVILSMFGGLALIFMVWAGQSLIVAGGNEEKIRQAKKLIGSTILGVVIVLAGYFLVNIIIGILITPVQQQRSGLATAIHGSEWARAYCGSPIQSDFCTNRSDGTNCVIHGVNGFCSNKICISACKYKLGNSGFNCLDITTCGELPAGTNDEKLAACTGTESDQGITECVTGLCPGDNYQVCCTP